MMVITTQDFVDKWYEMVELGLVTTVQDYSYANRVSPPKAKKILESGEWEKLPIGMKFIYVKKD